MTGRKLRVLACHPGASWATADVFNGLYHGLKYHDVEVFPYRLDQRYEASRAALHWLWRTKKKAQPDLPKPNAADLGYHASIGALEMALRQHVDVVLVVSGMLLHPDVLIMMKQAGLRVVVLFTESPYDHASEMKVAQIVDGGWTNERCVVNEFRKVNPRFGYLPHGWNPLVHRTDLPIDDSVPAHDVVFVGTAFRERVRWFNSIDWSGINLGLYGSWHGAKLNPQVRACVQEGPIDNSKAVLLYRRAKIGLNLYRTSQGWGVNAPSIAHAESINPRAYELAACGTFFLSDYRSESAEVFGDRVPMFRTPIEAAALIRTWLADEAGRTRLAAALPALVAQASWIDRTKTVLGGLQQLLSEAIPAIARSA
jgi:spore maturation protein CgeB